MSDAVALAWVEKLPFGGFLILTSPQCPFCVVAAWAIASCGGNIKRPWTGF
jgi:hypothetical protein